jgi:RNA polymerase primary sigma factor
MNLSDKDNKILLDLEQIVIANNSSVITRKRLKKINEGKAIPNPDEIDNIYDALGSKYGDKEISIFLDDWTPKKVKPELNVHESDKDDISSESEFSDEDLNDALSGWEDYDDDDSLSDKKSNQENPKDIDVIHNSESTFDNFLGTIQSYEDNDRLLFAYQAAKKEEDKVKIRKIQNKAIMINDRLIYKYVKIYNRKNIIKSLTEDDLYIMGAEGLLKALDKFSMNYNNTFSTYAVNWIQQSITRGIADEANTIRLPVHFVEALNKFNRTRNKLLKEKENVDLSDIAKEMGCSVDKVKNYSQVDYMINGSVSLDIPVGDSESSGTLGSLLPLKNVLVDENVDFSNGELYITNKLMEDENREIIYKELTNELSERDAEIIIHRFGLDGNDPMTLEEIGEIIGVTRERIRQIQNKVIIKLRNRCYDAQNLYPYNYEMTVKETKKKNKRKSKHVRKAKVK